MSNNKRREDKDRGLRFSLSYVSCSLSFWLSVTESVTSHSRPGSPTYYRNSDIRER